jgi:hypothetical protein
MFLTGLRLLGMTDMGNASKQDIINMMKVGGGLDNLVIQLHRVLTVGYR